MEDDVSSQLHPPRLRRGWSSARAFAASSTRVGARGFARARTMAGTMLARSSIASLAMLALSCGATSAPPPRASAPAPSAGASGDEWSRSSWEDRHDTMTWVVLPNMARLFQAHAKSELPTLACVTCHGPNAEAVHYEMPNGLPPLDPQHMPTAASSPTARFMIEEVTPTMKDLLGVSSFGCFNCHPSKGTP
jgi:hypothetical protein